MTHFSRCEHGIYLAGCRECFPLPKPSEAIEKFAKEMGEFYETLHSDQGPRHKDIMVCDFNLRFVEKDGEWVCSMPGWLLDVFENEVKK